MLRRPLTTVQALVSGPPVAPRRPLRIASLAASHHGLERLLGRTLVSHHRGPVRGPPWTSAAHGPRIVDQVYVFSH
jgi:hypothetical protein